MRNEDSGIALQTGQVAPTRAAAPTFENKAKPAPQAPATTVGAPRLDPDSKASLS